MHVTFVFSPCWLLTQSCNYREKCRRADSAYVKKGGERYIAGIEKKGGWALARYMVTYANEVKIRGVGAYPGMSAYSGWYSTVLAFHDHGV